MSENDGCTSVRTWVQIPSSHSRVGGKVLLASSIAPDSVRNTVFQNKAE